MRRKVTVFFAAVVMGTLLGSLFEGIIAEPLLMVLPEPRPEAVVHLIGMFMTAATAIIAFVTYEARVPKS